MKAKTVYLEQKQIDKLEKMGFEFGRVSSLNGEVNHSGLIRDLIDRVYAQHLAERVEIFCPKCGQWTWEPNTYPPTKCPHCGSPLKFVEVTKVEG